jgi:hypothetical protein
VGETEKSVIEQSEKDTQTATDLRTIDLRKGNDWNVMVEASETVRETENDSTDRCWTANRIERGCGNAKEKGSEKGKRKERRNESARGNGREKGKDRKSARGSARASSRVQQTTMRTMK